MKHLLLSLVLLDLPTSTTKTKKSIVRPATIYAISVTSRDGKTWTIQRCPAAFEHLSAMLPGPCMLRRRAAEAVATDPYPSSHPSSSSSPPLNRPPPERSLKLKKSFAKLIKSASSPSPASSPFSPPSQSIASSSGLSHDRFEERISLLLARILRQRRDDDPDVRAWFETDWGVVVAERCEGGLGEGGCRMRHYAGVRWLKKNEMEVGERREWEVEMEKEEIIEKGKGKSRAGRERSGTSASESRGRRRCSSATGGVHPSDRSSTSRSLKPTDPSDSGLPFDPPFVPPTIRRPSMYRSCSSDLAPLYPPPTTPLPPRPSLPTSHISYPIPIIPPPASTTPSASSCPQSSAPVSAPPCPIHRRSAQQAVSPVEDSPILAINSFATHLFPVPPSTFSSPNLSSFRPKQPPAPLFPTSRARSVSSASSSRSTARKFSGPVNSYHIPSNMATSSIPHSPLPTLPPLLSQTTTFHDSDGAFHPRRTSQASTLSSVGGGPQTPVTSASGFLSWTLPEASEEDGKEFGRWAGEEGEEEGEGSYEDEQGYGVGIAL